MLAAALASCDRPVAAAVRAAAARGAAQATAAAAGSSPRIPPKSAWPFLDASAAAPTDGRFDPAAVIKRNYYVVLDASGSMNDQQVLGQQSARSTWPSAALMQFAQHIPADANLGGLVFDEQGVHSLIPIGPLDPAKLRRAIAPCRRAAARRWRRRFARPTPR